MQKLLLNRNDNTEIEIRIKGITKFLFDKVYQHFLKSDIERGDIECSLNIIDKNKIRKDIFKNKNEKITTYYSKIRDDNLIVKKGNVEFNIVRSTELAIDRFKLSSSGLLFRFKKRASFYLEDESRYRVDMTIVRETKNQTELLNAKTQLFGDDVSKITFENFTEMFSNINNTIKHEIEIEFIKSDNDFADWEFVVGYFEDLINDNIKKMEKTPNKYVSELKYILNKKHARNLKGVLNQAKALTKFDYRNIYPPINYYITDKKDGIRCVLFVDMTTLTLVTDMNEKQINQNNDREIIGSILDGELVDDVFYAFDIIKYGGGEDKYIHIKPFTERFVKLQKCVDLINNELVKMSNLTKLEENNYKQIIKSFKTSKKKYEVDGLIFTSPNDNYLHTKNYKWKPISMNTIDFLVLKCPNELTGLEPLVKKPNKTLYLLFVGIDVHFMNKIQLEPMYGYEKVIGNIEIGQYRPIQFSPSIWPNAYVFHSDRDDLHMKICELLYDNYSWKFIKVREDRQVTHDFFGNNYSVAEKTLMIFLDPLTYEDLYEFKDSSYFRNKSGYDDQVVTVNKYNRFVIDEIFKRYLQNTKFVIDLASGRGADLYRYAEQKVKKVLFVERDKLALTRIIEKKLQKHKNAPTKTLPKILVHHADLTTEHSVFMKNLSEVSVVPLSADVIVCNFAIHYLCDNEMNIDNICKIVSSLLKPDGYFIFTTFDGKRIFELLTDKVWVSSDGKYRIEKLYTDKTLKKHGQFIRVKLPFADELYEEPLCNIEAFASFAKRHELIMIENESFGKYFDVFKNTQLIRYEQLTDEDKHYINLHNFVVFKKIQKQTKSGGRRYVGRPRKRIVK